ncbi:hypothetical protein TNIN_13791 [Trichonephila inaurata madagascariensis]|uniref:Uncharacterized protein n=1 Tax=Trichonephila inaurata madagascariensis TaxID=2747483 RepID=A0A8X6MK26_9ARAC|nr:hypothetical protein TNIN_13791 [Trichonephila inaurata madagascariensis]
MRGCIRFVRVERCNCTKIYWKFHNVFGENIMLRQAIMKCCSMFEHGFTVIEDDKREERQSTEIIACVSPVIFANRRLVTKDEEVDMFHESIQTQIKLQ